MSRLEEIKQKYMECEYDYALKSMDIEWLINRVEYLENEYKVRRAELLEEHIDRLEKVNRSYKQALVHAKNDLKHLIYGEFVMDRDKTTKDIFQHIDQTLKGESK